MRNPDKLKVDICQRSGIHIIQGDLKNIERHGALLSTIDTAILIATSWGDPQECFDINVTANLTLVNLLDPDRVQQVIYFSTASILNRQNQPLPEAGEIGTDYIRSKYECFSQLAKLAIAPKITTVFPTLVFGEDGNKPYSHLSAGLPDVVKWINLVRWFKADGSFHFIHARDIAQIVRYLVDCPLTQFSWEETEGMSVKQLVLGNPYLTVNEAVEEICAYLNKRIYLRIPLSIWLANFFITVFRIHMDDWSRFSLNYRHFTHQNPVNPTTFGLTPYCATVADILKISGISRGSRAIR